ncbi:MAG: TIGR03564 family F420-dependent LLM class oxidoreductase [Acidimicrobiia bacterium]|nr:TIGR03564 family F420-dependent LLM class oxidoreductase [Acidimicrobiia bacterium]
MRIAINGSSSVLAGRLDDTLADMASVVDAGFHSYWLAQTTLVDALSAFAVAGATGRAPAEVGTAVVPTFPRHPFALAAQAHTVQEALPGRLVLGIGLSHQPVVEEAWGLTFERPVRHMSDYLAILEGLLHEGSVRHRGEIWSATIDGAPPQGTPPSIMVAAMGEQMLRLAGRRTDGTILWMVGARTIAEHVAPTIGAAAEQAGRPTPRIVASLPVCVTDDPSPVRDLIATMLVRYGELPSYRAMLDREGAAGPADVSIVGNEEEVDAVLDALAEAGATDFAAVEFGTNPDEQARTRALLHRRA